MVNYKIFEDKIELMFENSIIRRFTDLWDDVILPLLEKDLITDEEAEEAYSDEYLRSTLRYFIEEYIQEKKMEV